MNDVTPPLSVTGVDKSYGAQKVLEQVNLTLKAGEIFGLIGLNGAGKTTLIKIILGLARANAGEVALFGRPPSDVAARANLCYLPEKFQPSRYLKGMEYLSLSLSYYGKTLDQEEARRRATQFDLNPDKLISRVGAYSKGMGQKIGLLAAFMADTPLLILDEPMSGLDPSARIKLKDMVQAARAKGKTVFFSSHILSDIDEICDRIGVIHGGKLFFTGTPGEFRGLHGNDTLEKTFLKSIAA